VTANKASALANGVSGRMAAAVRRISEIVGPIALRLDRMDSGEKD